MYFKLGSIAILSGILTAIWGWGAIPILLVSWFCAGSLARI